MKKKKIDGLNFDLQQVPTTNSGALYQLVEGDPTNDAFLEKMRESAKARKEEEA